MSDARLLSRRLDALLSAYIEIHDDVFGWSIRRIIPIPGMFKTIDFAGHEANLRAIADEIQKLAGSFGTLPHDGPYVCGALAAVQAYTHALNDAVARLQAICGRLKAKADGAPYPMREYNADVTAYRRSVKKYHSLGEGMNAAFSILSVQFA